VNASKNVPWNSRRNIGICAVVKFVGGDEGAGEGGLIFASHLKAKNKGKSLPLQARGAQRVPAS